MMMRTDPARGATPVGHPAIEQALETLPFVTRACVARSDERETVVLVSVDPGRFDGLESASPVKAEARRVLTRNQILEHVWDEHADPFTNTVRVTVGTLRRKLEKAGPSAPIETVIGRGYRLVDAPTGG